MNRDLPKRGSRWTHLNGFMKYTVLFIANKNTKSDKHPVMVVYIGDNGNYWCREISTWHDSMFPTKEKEDE